jgi:hypothetical protein
MRLATATWGITIRWPMWGTTNVAGEDTRRPRGRLRQPALAPPPSGVGLAEAAPAMSDDSPRGPDLRSGGRGGTRTPDSCLVRTPRHRHLGICAVPRANRHSARRHEPPVRWQNVGKPLQPVTWPAANPARHGHHQPSTKPDARASTLLKLRVKAPNRYHPCGEPTRAENRARRPLRAGRGGRALARRPRGGSRASSASTRTRPIPRSAGSSLD